MGDIVRLFGLAVRHHQAGELDCADGLYGQILATDPHHALSLHNLGLLRVQQGSPDSAVELIGQAIALNDRIAEWHYNLAFSFGALGRIGDAVIHYKRAIALKPDYVEAEMNLGNALKAQGGLDEAAACYRRVIALDPRAIEAQYNLANVLAQQGRWNEAQSAYEWVLALAPDFAEAHNNLGIVLGAQGRLDEAATRHQRAITLNPSLAEAYVNLGKLRAEQGAPEAAVALHRQALALAPNDALAHNNLGVALMALGRMDEAIASCRQGLALKADFAELHNNLAVALTALGRIDEAIASCRRALALRPDFIEAHDNVARACLAVGDVAGALRVLARALGIRETPDSKILFVDALRASQSVFDVTGYRDLVIRALSEPWGRPIDVAPVATALVLLDEEVAGGVGRAAKAWPSRLCIDELLTPQQRCALAGNGLLRSLLESAGVPDKALERFLTGLRFAMLDRAGKAAGVAPADHPDELLLYCALARHCFGNDYAFDCTDAELAQAHALRERLAVALHLGTSVPALWVVAVAAYFPLCSLPAAASLRTRSWPDAVDGLLTLQVDEPRREDELRPSVPHLTAIKDGTSLTVRQQYLENPYPRWAKAALAGKQVTIDDYIRRRMPEARFHPLGKTAAVDVLIAGCGTGQHSVEVARRLKGARVLAIDLSLTSLAYAKRQTLALGLDMIEYGQADLLELASLGRSFDLIEAAGSLQTLADPPAGLRVLSSLLRPGGLMLLGLYSEIARRDIVAARAFIAERGFRPIAADMRRCRQELMDQPHGTPLRNVTHSPDFCSLSECRDLLFHVREHRSDLAEIKRWLGENELRFVGFEVDPRVRQQYRTRFPQDRAMDDLDNWHQFEQDNPLTFVGMYQLWAQKSPSESAGG